MMDSVVLHITPAHVITTFFIQQQNCYQGIPSFAHMLHDLLMLILAGSSSVPEKSIVDRQYSSSMDVSPNKENTQTLLSSG